LQIGCRETGKLGKGDEDGNPENSFCDGFFGKFPLALKYALSFAEKYAAKLFILHVIQQPSYPLGMYAEILSMPWISSAATFPRSRKRR